MKLRGAEEQLEAANRTLRDKQQALAAVEARVAELQRSLAEAQHEQRTLSDQVSWQFKQWYMWTFASGYLGHVCKRFQWGMVVLLWSLKLPSAMI